MSNTRAKLQRERTMWRCLMLLIVASCLFTLYFSDHAYAQTLSHTANN